MSTPARVRPPRRRKRVALSRPLVVGLLVLLVFLLGVAIGEALHDNPRPGGTQTILRTFTR